MLELGGAVVSVLDRLDREDVQLLPQSFCVEYVDNTLPSRCYASHDLVCA